MLLAARRHARSPRVRRRARRAHDEPHAAARGDDARHALVQTLRGSPRAHGAARRKGDGASLRRRRARAARDVLPRRARARSRRVGAPRRRRNTCIMQPLGSRSDRAHHVLGDALLLARDAPGARRHSRAARARHARVRGARRAASARHVASRVRVSPRSRPCDGGRGRALHDPRHARRHARAAATTVRRARADFRPRAASRSSRAIKNRVEAFGRAKKVIPATRTTEIFIATSASTCPRSTSTAKSSATAIA